MANPRTARAVATTLSDRARAERLSHHFAYTVSTVIVLSQVAFTLLILLVLMHLGVLAGALFPVSIFAALHSANAIVLIIWLAL